MTIYSTKIATPDGEFVVRFSGRGLCQLRFPTSHDPAPSPEPKDKQLLAWLNLTRAALQEALAGRAPRKLPPLDISEGTEFQQKLWRALLAIPRGKTMTYGEIADAIDSPKAVRAAGAACGANPIAVLIPCHRVTAANGKLGGFSSPLAWKRKLLEREGVGVTKSDFNLWRLV